MNLIHLGQLVTQIDPKLCTHLIQRGFVVMSWNNVNNTCQIELANQDKTIDSQSVNYQTLREMANRNPALKIFIQYGLPSFINVADISHRCKMNFINSTISFLRKYPYDGVDLEFSLETKTPNVLSLMKLMKKEFKTVNFLLSATLYIQLNTISK